VSWDSFESKETCPCGRGTYRVVLSSNDWGQSRTEWHMDCRSCKSAYSLHTFEYYSNGLRDEGHAWVRTGPYKEAKQLEREALAVKEQALALAKKKHLGSIVARLDGISKKRIWSAIHAAVPNYKSLGTFYLHTKGMVTREIASTLFSDFELQAVWKLLGVQDKEVTQMLASAASLQKKSEVLLRTNSAR